MNLHRGFEISTQMLLSKKKIVYRYSQLHTSFYLQWTNTGKFEASFKIPIPRVLRSLGLARSHSASLWCLYEKGKSSESTTRCLNNCTYFQSVTSARLCRVEHTPCDLFGLDGRCVISGTKIPHICAACRERFASRMRHRSSPASIAARQVQAPSNQRQ